MKKLYIGSFILTFLVYGLFVISYPFLDSSEDVIEELTFSNLMVSFPNHQYPSAAKDYVAALERAALKMGIDPDKELFDAIDDSENISNISITEISTISQKVSYNDPWEAKVDSLLLTFTSKKIGSVSMRFLVSDKSIMPPNLSYFIMLQSLTVDGQELVNGGYGPDVLQVVENIFYQH